MFKKRLNFADGVQIAIVSKMWLLRFLSGKFWQHTAVSHIPLHTVFVELQPQKWAGTSRVRWIQLWNSLSNKQQCMCVKYCFKLGKLFVNCWSKLCGEECMSRTQCYEWFKSFKEGRTSVSKDPRPGWPSTSTDDHHVERVREVICTNRRLTVRDSVRKWCKLLNKVVLLTVRCFFF